MLVVEIASFRYILKVTIFENNLIYKDYFFVPTPTLVGREELYTQLGFFVQSILADRYIHRREL